LRRLINQQLGHRNFTTFVNEYRLSAAAARLVDRNKLRVPVLTIALDLGWGSIGPLNRAFRARFGMTPTDYRRAKTANPAPQNARRFLKSGLAIPPRKNGRKMCNCRIVQAGAMLAQSDLDGCAQGSQEECNGHLGRRVDRVNGRSARLIGVIVPRKIAAGVEPAHRNGKFATLTRDLAHDVSILLGVGRHLGSQPHVQPLLRVGGRRVDTE
jgi:hypothetical protein